MTVSRRQFILACLLLLAGLAGLVLWIRSHDAERASAARVRAESVTEVQALDCPVPFADQLHPEHPLQSATIAPLPAPFALAHGTATPLAAFAVEGRVLGNLAYTDDREARFAPNDLAFGWGRMRDPAIIDQLAIRQSGRWFRYTVTYPPPIPVEEIVRSAANMHMVPASTRVADAIAAVKQGEIVRVDGFLVSIADGQGWGWHSSMTREDAGAGACELVLVCRVQVLPQSPAFTASASNPQ